MKRVFSLVNVGFVLCLISSSVLAQPAPGVYTGSDPDNPGHVHEVKLNGEYLVYSEFSKAPDFIRARGGFYTSSEDSLRVTLEFNSAYEQDSTKTMVLAYQMDGSKLVLNEGRPISLEKAPGVEQDLDGTWLFATRGPDTGQERRGDTNPRKTLKFLMDGHFQWIAYHTETMAFSGTGGGDYTAKDGVYTEIIRYFSRDNSRVGAELEFNYERKGADWHHTGKNSRGEPMYEIWSLRD
ncbi:hypothetical protein SAMN06265375_101787 [Muriicola jejuensis]|uniref:Membrane or secreted protein n=1 Tax=Muriicola jejuensis TaxID=504488 RepID=A0A6P0U9I8_9FLAO|nr:hypothetical protein [Muriicola jejuensis]NER09697.1 hypothetical protein [Muriicola jejuensis]SMP06501.1 hypothetical protein SAMN06265375_101787 [Muriicola jejuensis]